MKGYAEPVITIFMPKLVTEPVSAATVRVNVAGTMLPAVKLVASLFHDRVKTVLAAVGFHSVADMLKV